ncbi:MAG: hypothetical protein K2Q25_08405 [Mycobacteriaceae bacterium]|nr:hypothetical protein [Mycobacteriaceae bacterium]
MNVGRWLQQDIIDRSRLPLLCCLTAFILTFFVTRTFVRFIRYRAEAGLPPKWWQPRNIHIGSKHIHHVTFGVVLVMISGLIMVMLSVDGQQAQRIAAAIFFGIGAALVLDEYALILHLSDVYWEEDGRTSVDAVFVAIAVTGLLMLGFQPLMFIVAIWHDTHWLPLRVVTTVAIVMALPVAVIVLLKGKVWTGLVGMFFPILLLIGAIRLSRPHAPWARWRYTSRPDKMWLALQRERTLRRPVVRAKLWLQCVLAGTPRAPEDYLVDAELDREVHPAPPPHRSENTVAVGSPG